MANTSTILSQNLYPSLKQRVDSLLHEIYVFLDNVLVHIVFLEIFKESNLFHLWEFTAENGKSS